jgi:iron(III) transport system ATP-binding protein
LDKTLKMQNNPAIELLALHKAFGAVQAVQHATLNAQAGQIVALLGASGCGKTTLLRLIAGFERPDQGKILINGRVVADASAGQFTPPENRHVGMVFQDYALFPHLNVLENIMFGVRARPEIKRTRAKEMLALVGLNGLAERLPHALSGGQQQRVALARALAPQPEVLLLDEPFSNLDSALRTQVRTEVRRILKTTGITGLFVTHDQEEALSLADMVAVMIDGQIVQADSPTILYQRPNSPQVARFLGEANFLPGISNGESVDCIFGKIPLHQSLPPGQAILMLRPEQVLLGEGIPAQVLWQEFYGYSARVGLALPDGESIVARVLAHQLDFLKDNQVLATVRSAACAYQPQTDYADYVAQKS